MRGPDGAFVVHPPRTTTKSTNGSAKQTKSRLEDLAQSDNFSLSIIPDPPAHTSSPFSCLSCLSWFLPEYNHEKHEIHEWGGKASEVPS